MATGVLELGHSERDQAPGTGGGRRYTPQDTLVLEVLLPVSIQSLLDLLLIIVLIMFLPIGLWRGMLREWITFGGIAFGYLLAGEWASAWGNDLAALRGWDPKVVTFFVGALVFLGAAVILGYGVGAALPYRPDLTPANRVVGGLLSLGNGTLILSCTLRIMQRYLFDDQRGSPLLNSRLAAFLIDYIGWGYLVLVLLCGGIVLTAVAQRVLGGAPLMEEYAPTYTVALRPEWSVQDRGNASPVADSTEADEAAWKEADTAVLRAVAPPVEDTRQQPATPDRHAPAAPPAAPRAITISRPPGPQQPSAPVQANDHQGGPKSNGQHDRRDERASDEALHRAAPSLAQEHGEQSPCAVCGGKVAHDARFCPTCGHIIGEAEQRQINWRR